MAIALLGSVCICGPLLQTLRFRRFGQGSPWRVPVAATPEGVGWIMIAGSLVLVIGQGALVIADQPWYPLLPALPLPEWARLAGLAVGLAGAATAFGSQMAMAASWRVGTDPDSERPLVTAGIFGRIRNPIYLGLLLQILGGAMLLPTILSLVAVVDAIVGLNLVVGSEERFLANRYGDEYRAYMGRTGRFLPRGKLGS